MTTRWTIRGCRALAVAGVTLAGVLLAGRVDAQSLEAATGAYLFRTYCAACHGTSARGDGPVAGEMRRRPSDLTQIARSHKGVFPTEKVSQMIDGRQPVRGHGGPGMPVWGDVFTRSVETGDPVIVEARIKALVTYLESIQARTAF